VLAHWNNSPWIDMSLHSDTLSWFWANLSLFFLLKLGTLTITPPMWLSIRTKYIALLLLDHYTSIPLHPQQLMNFFFTYTAQCKGENKFPENILCCSYSNRTSTQPSWPEITKQKYNYIVWKLKYSVPPINHHPHLSPSNLKSELTNIM
jgi:hypothetical protein